MPLLNVIVGFMCHNVLLLENVSIFFFFFVFTFDMFGSVLLYANTIGIFFMLLIFFTLQKFFPFD